MELVDLKNRKILVTGASSGIGREVSILLSKLGATVVLCGRDEQELVKTRKLMNEPNKHQIQVFDVTDYQRYPEVFNEIIKDGVKMDGFVHCAGIGKAIPLRVVKHSDIMNILETNYVSFIELLQIFSKKKYSSGGSIVVMSAVSAHYPLRCMTIYSASKAALETSVQTLALEMTHLNFRINCVIPGIIDTRMTRVVDDHTLNALSSKQLLGIGKPEDVANMVAFLLSDASKFITGRSMYVDGGMLGQ